MDPQKAVFMDDQTQKELNTPLKDATGAAVNRDFLVMLMRLINEGKIGMYKPDSLINHEVYDRLDQQARGKIDIEATNLLSTIRDIKGLYDAGYADTYQIENLVEKLRLTKERLENIGGDLFII